MAADLEALGRALRRIDGFAAVGDRDLQPMLVKGLAHEHIRIAGRGLVLRVPRLSQFGLPPEANLDYQQACFERAASSRATPRIHGVLPVEDRIPYGALIVEEIVGRAPRIPDDMAALADCLAALHMLPLPAEEGRAPLGVHADAVSGTLHFIETQAAYLPEAGLVADAARQIEEELDWARRFAAEAHGRSQPIALVGTDTHPGNFLIDSDGRAIFVDLEKALYGSPAIDLAHASVYTSTMWDPEIAAVLTPDQVEEFYARYLDRVPGALADGLRPWLAPLRRLTWLRTTTWCVKWCVEAAKAPAASGSTRERSAWSAERYDAGMIAGVRARIDDYFNPETITRIRAEWSGAKRLSFDRG
jgi:hypothetical protein